MTELSDGVEVDILFVALTRPATAAGIPYIAFVVEIMIVVIIFLAVGNPLYLISFVPIHALLYSVSATNPNFFASAFLWIKTNGRCINSRYWGSVSFSPLQKNRIVD